ncbi:MAG: TatD family hydrolase [Tannerella sp.]|jgi:TatD DNase family protein|nr:TatD family hydrolase [Tannerella sp.]
MIYCDIHTHQPPVHTEDIAVISVDLLNSPFPPGFLPERKNGEQQHRDLQSAPAPEDTMPTRKIYFAVGIHPWQPDIHLMNKVREYAAMPSVAAIGETGLDKITAKEENNFRLQQELFAAHVRLAEELGKPLIIHCVKAWDELLHVRKSIRPTVPWVIHGFRGNDVLAERLINAGLYLSFGADINPTALKTVWGKRRLFAETDNKNIHIRDIYKRIAENLNITDENLSEAIETSFRRLIH